MGDVQGILFMTYKKEHVKKRFRLKLDKLLDQVRRVMRYHH